jgi:hypothetical protein
LAVVWTALEMKNPHLFPENPPFLPEAPVEGAFVLPSAGNNLTLTEAASASVVRISKLVNKPTDLKRLK